MDGLQQRLRRLSSNLWWSWNQQLDPVFRQIDVELWRAVNHNPVAFLQDVDPDKLAREGKDATLLAQVVRAEMTLSEHLKSDDHWASWNAPGLTAFPVAYFSAEFCIHECLPMYSGGLGVLAGDHLKSCSDLGIPVCGVTLLYREGYFKQQIDARGHQHERYQVLDTQRVPIQRAQDSDGKPLRVDIPTDGDVITVDIWTALVGRCTLLLLDVSEVSSAAYPQTVRLYGGDRRNRIVQEIVLGVGGYRALRKLGIRPGVIHLNEGHSAFAVLEAIATLMAETGMPFEHAASEIAQSVVFTTHTPVAAGHDYFQPAELLPFLGGLRKRLGLSESELLALGRIAPGDSKEAFCMTVLGLKLSRSVNGVSALHGMVSRRMWRCLWPTRRVADVPIGHITNGAHVDTWQASEMGQLFADQMGSDWRDAMCYPTRWRKLDDLDEFTLWSVKRMLKLRLFDFIERRVTVRNERLQGNAPLPQLDLDRLTIGYGRRFAAYKRATLLLDDVERATRLLTDPQRPVQLVIAGKAHPADEEGKALLRRVHELSQDPRLRDHLVLVEDYDSNVSRHLIEGCDLWLNSPRRPLEACGTSGMKAVFNGTLNCSALDGWWQEAYDGLNGFAFGDGMVHVDPAVQDERDRESLLQVLSDEVIPLYYAQTERGYPDGWLRRIKHAFRTLGWRYNADRMVMDYVHHEYLRASMTATSEYRGPTGRK